MLTCSKVYRDIPFAHRAHADAGHCHFIHGHSWDFEFTFLGEPDARGWVVDFGSLGWLKDYIREFFDHSCLVNHADPQLPVLRMMQQNGLLQLREVPDCSCEGIARTLYIFASSAIISKGYTGRLRSVTVREGLNNSATYSSEGAPTYSK